MIIFNGYKVAQEREKALQAHVASIVPGSRPITIAAIMFREDAGSKVYTRLKQEAAARIGMRYLVFEHSLTDSVTKIKADIIKANQYPTITGIIIQKPTRAIWQELSAHAPELPQSFDAWWRELTSTISQDKDVDGLHPDTLTEIEQGTWQENGRVLPATCQAVLSILEVAPVALQQAKALIIGKSDLLGIPLFHVLRKRGVNVELLRKADLDARKADGRLLLDATVVISATGVPGLITGDMVTQGTVLIDVGEPKADITLESVREKAAFLTPVPGGVGPLTVISLLENAVQLYTMLDRKGVQHA
ncbi:bifunctional 5,10-methylenetetrahydrofolate dehydrogenase/5,10-methenyltetrahydrofolate cyclohydrolase [Candidatus Woesebacteria bacterium]|nr:bifunctional 5,10-methylenetetrahydrofolate dehydrogenase/5,10-methenyltetrahydrofolate cyclohydrolase [Candidatus Woesebacteria bacterium]